MPYPHESEEDARNLTACNQETIGRFQIQHFLLFFLYRYQNPCSEAAPPWNWLKKKKKRIVSCKDNFPFLNLIQISVMSIRQCGHLLLWVYATAAFPGFLLGCLSARHYADSLRLHLFTLLYIYSAQFSAWLGLLSVDNSLLQVDLSLCLSCLCQKTVLQYLFSFSLWFILDQFEKQTATNPVLLMDEALARLFMKQLLSDLISYQEVFKSVQDSLLASLPPTRLLTADTLQARQEQAEACHCGSIAQSLCPTCPRVQGHGGQAQKVGRCLLDQKAKPADMLKQNEYNKTSENNESIRSSVQREDNLSFQREDNLYFYILLKKGKYKKREGGEQRQPPQRAASLPLTGGHVTVFSSMQRKGYSCLQANQ